MYQGCNYFNFSDCFVLISKACACVTVVYMYALELRARCNSYYIDAGYYVNVVYESRGYSIAVVCTSTW